MKILFEAAENESVITPIKVAEALITHGQENYFVHIEGTGYSREVNVTTFGMKELLEIAEHLQVYCKYNRIDKEEGLE